MRADLQLLLRLRRDLKVLPLFLVAFVILGEFTPLLVPFLTPIVPPTLRIPSQVDKIRASVAEQRRKVRASGAPAPADANPVLVVASLFPDRFGDDKNATLANLGRARWVTGVDLGLFPAWWGTMWPRMLWSRLMARRLAPFAWEIVIDTSCLEREVNASQRLLLAEVILALERRGIDVEGKSEIALRSDLEDWMQKFNK